MLAPWFAAMFLKPPPDYEGSGTGTVIVKINPGDSIPAIANTPRLQGRCEVR